MLLKFADPDMLNTQLIDASTGQIKYMILSRASYILGRDKTIVGVASRITTITNVAGNVIAIVEWTGKEKRSGGVITIMNYEPVKFAQLFDGCDSVKTIPDHLIIPSRLGYDWVATRGSLFVCHSDTEEVVAKCFERCVQIGNTIKPSPVPMMGKDFLEFSDQLSEDTVAELLVGYIFMNIMRRTRFNLPRYQFPLVDGLEETRQSIADVITHVKDSLGRRTSTFRRNTLS